MILNWRNHQRGGGNMLAVGGTALIIVYSAAFFPGGTARITQEAVESLEANPAPNGRITQIARESLEQEPAPHARITQVAVEMLIPFTCVFPPPPFIPPSGCPENFTDPPVTGSRGCPDFNDSAASGNNGCGDTLNNG